jgi:hypothetical protein
MSMSEAAARWADGVKQKVFAAAQVYMSMVAETLLAQGSPRCDLVGGEDGVLSSLPRPVLEGRS